MALPLLVPIAKALISQAPKIAAKQFSKKAVKSAAKDFVKGKVKDKLKDRKKKKGGALAKTESGLSTFGVSEKQTSKVSPQKLLPQGVDVDTNVQTVSTKGKVSYDKIQQQLDNIEGITSALNKAFEGELTAKKEAAAKAKKAKQNARKKEREEKREGKTTSPAGMGSILPKGDPFSIMNFLKNILLGGALLFLLKQGPKIAKVFGFLKDNLYATFLVIKYGLRGLKSGFRLFGSAVKGIGKIVVKIALAPFKLAAKGIKTGFKALGTGIKNFAVSVINRLRKLLGLKPPPGSKPGKPGKKPGSGKATLTGSGATTGAQLRGQSATAGYRSPGRYRMPGQALAGGTFWSQIERRGAPRSFGSVRPGSFASKAKQFGASLQTGTANVPLSPGAQRGLYNAPGRIQRGLSKGAVKTQKAVGAVNGFIKKIFGITNPAQIQGLRQAAPALKKGSSVLSRAPLPVVGPLIVFTMNALDPDISVGKAAFKAVGAGLGEFLGFLTPIPGIGQIIGPILGGLAGEVLGGAAYELIVNGDEKAAGQEIIDAFMSALEVGKMAVEWLKGAGERFYEAMPKIKIPDLPGWAKRIDFSGLLQALPFWGKEVIEPDLGKILWAIPGAMKNAVFGEKKEEGKKEELKLPSESESKSSLSSTPTTPMVERYTSPSQEESKAKKKLAFLLRASAAIDDKKLEKKGDETKVIIPGLGFYMSGRGLFSGHVDKYFDENANVMTEEVFMKRLKNMENVQRDILKIEKEKKAASIVSSTASATPGASTPMSTPTGTLSQQQAFKLIYDLAKADGRAKFPEVVAAQAMHETGYLANPNSVYFRSGKTNPFGQTGDRGYGTMTRAGDPSGWTLYPDLKTAVSDHISLWHLTDKHSGNYNAFDTILQGVASVAPAYSPNADPANIRLGYTVDAYSKGVVRALKVGGFDPKATAGQASQIMATTVATQPSQPATTPSSSPQNNEQQKAQLAQRQRIQELQKKIEGAEKLLATGGLVAQGTSMGYIVRQNLKADKKELAKLTASATTPIMPTSSSTTTPSSTTTSSMQTSGSAIQRAGQTTGAQTGNMISGFEVTSGYGQRWGRLHGGIDIGTPVGTFVGLSVPVEIVFAGLHGSAGSGYGNVVDAWAPSLGLQFRLAHLNTILCQKGQKLPAGAALGKTGGASNDPGRGSSTGPHLHFEVDNKKNGTTYGGLGNPSPYVQYLILSANGPAAGATVTTPGAVTTAQQSAAAVAQDPSYSSNSNTIVLPSSQQQQPMMSGGGQGQGAVIMGGSTTELVNSYYKKQLLGFLYKQG